MAMDVAMAMKGYDDDEVGWHGNNDDDDNSPLTLSFWVPSAGRWVSVGWG